MNNKEKYLTIIPGHYIEKTTIGTDFKKIINILGVCNEIGYENYYFIDNKLKDPNIIVGQKNGQIKTIYEKIHAQIIIDNYVPLNVENNYLMERKKTDDFLMRDFISLDYEENQKKIEITVNNNNKDIIINKTINTKTNFMLNDSKYNDINLIINKLKYNGYSNFEINIPLTINFNVDKLRETIKILELDDINVIEYLTIFYENEIFNNQLLSQSIAKSIQKLITEEKKQQKIEQFISPKVKQWLEENENNNDNLILHNNQDYQSEKTLKINGIREYIEKIK